MPINRFGPAERVVVASQPLAIDAAHAVLAAGGSVVDAAVSAAAVLCVVEPGSTSVGGDLFALVWPTGAAAPAGLDSAGGAPAGMSVETLRGAGFTTMPRHGPWSVTVPGAVAGWGALLDRFGRLGLEQVLAPAVAVAEEGFRVTPRIAREWASAVGKLARDAAAAAVFLDGGRAPAAGERWANPALGALLRRLGAEGLRSVYAGELADRIAHAVAVLGGPLTAEDLAAWTGPEWVDALTVEFDGVTVHELPPPSQGLVALQAIALYADCDRGDPIDAEHAAIEALKIAFAQAHAHLADPATTPGVAGRLLDPRHLAALRAGIDPRRATPAARVGPASDTVFLAVADVAQGACALIQSLYEGFGSGIGVPGLGFVLQNRAACFDLDPGHPNHPAPRKRPYHTIIPALLSRDGVFAGCLGVVGGFMQPQGHLQVLRNVVERGLTPQQAVDAPRFRLHGGNHVAYEQGADPALLAALAGRGHHLTTAHPDTVGGAQLILRDGDALVGGTDRRKDGRVPAG